MIIASPNLCFDRTHDIPALVPGAVIRSGAVAVTAGGKGVNVARVLRAHGLRGTLVGLVGDDDRADVLSLLAGERIQVVAVPMAGRTRVNVIMVERQTRRVTVLNEPGAEIDGDAWSRYRAAVLAAVGDGEVLVCSGSLPPGAPVDGYGDLVASARAAGALTIVDTAPAPLRAALAAGPDLVTPNLHEAEAALSGDGGDLLGQDDVTESERPADVADRARAAAAALCSLGARRAAVTAGAAGVALAGEGPVRWVPAVPVEVVSAVGAGDSFVGGVVVALAGRRPPDWWEAVLRGTATATASCEQLLAGGVDPARAQDLLDQIRATLDTNTLDTDAPGRPDPIATADPAGPSTTANPAGPSTTANPVGTGGAR